MAETPKKVYARPAKPFSEMTREEKLEFGRGLFRAINDRSPQPDSASPGASTAKP